MLKEITLSYRIGENDYQVRKRSIERFLVEGNKVKVTIRLRGREEQHADMAAALLRRFHTETEELSVMEREPRLEGRHVIMILAPRKENK
jgi:translation initiation factor IF-3